MLSAAQFVLIGEAKERARAAFGRADRQDIQGVCYCAMSSINIKKPVIVYLGGFLLPDRNAASHRAIGNAKIFSLFGYDTRIVGFEPLHRKSARRDGWAARGIGLVTLDAKVSKLPLVGSFRLNAASAIAYIRSLAKHRPIAAVVCYNYPSIAQARIQLYCRHHGLTYVSDVTEWNADSGRNILHDRLRAADLSLRVRMLNRLAGRLITTSPYMTAFYGRNKHRIAEIPTLFDKVTIAMRRPRVRDPDDPVRLMFVGPGFDTKMARVAPRLLKERIDLVVHTTAAARNQGGQVTLDIYGIDRPSFDRFFPEEAKIIAAHGAAFSFHGRVPHAEILAGLHEADFSIIMRDNKRGNNAGFPTKFAESLLSGTPVIIDRIESLAPHFAHPHAIVLDRATPEAMGAQLLAAVAAYRRRQQRNAPRAEEFETFHYSNFADEMSNVIDPLQPQSIRRNSSDKQSADQATPLDARAEEASRMT